MTNPFGAAIETLSPLAGRPEIARAIRVLERAGEVVSRRGLILRAMEEIHKDEGSRNIIVNFTKHLVEALPDESRQISRQNGAVKE